MNRCLTMQLSFEGAILHQFINKKPSFIMNAITQQRNNIRMLNFTQQIYFSLQIKKKPISS